MYNENTDTIAAIATGMTNSGIGIIRVSGDNAIEAVDSVFQGKKGKTLKDLESYNAAYGTIVDGEEIIDEVIVLVMRAPGTYTKEDVVEIDCHGGIVVVKRILQLILSKGIRIAEPGEFTKRAFLNGRIDLSQAESVMDLIHAKNEFAAKSSLKQLRGDLSDQIKDIREKILYEIAFIESALDDPEHYSLDGYPEQLKEKIDGLQKKIHSLLESSDDGRMLKEGINTVIIGKPNAGKSSVLNYLLGEERAIVTDIAGTTRDTLEEFIHINGIPLHITDTAGIRDTKDIVEKLGVEKAKKSIEEADLILYVVDASIPLDSNDEAIIEQIKEKQVIVLLNKQDLPIEVDKLWITSQFGENIVDLSAKNHVGLDDLTKKIGDMFFHGRLTFNDEIYITNMRHKDALLKAEKSLLQVMESIDNGMEEDFYSIDLMAAYEELGFIIGESLEDDLVNKIFQEFCMGK